MMAGTKNFSYVADRPAEKTRVMQKWGWTGTTENAWIDLRFSSQVAGDANATVHLAYLRSYEGMGAARVSCQRGCACAAGEVEGAWVQRSSLTQIHSFEVSAAGAGDSVHRERGCRAVGDYIYAGWGVACSPAPHRSL